MTGKIVQGIAEPVVYVVDGESAVRTSLSLLLASVGLTVKAFASAQEFLDHFHPDQPGCLLLEVRMPGMGGLEIQERLVREGAIIPILFISCHTDWSTVVRAMKHGAIDFLEKPFNHQQLVDLVQKAIRLDAHRRTGNRLQSEAMARLATLSEREREIADLLAAGLRSKEIATRLTLSIKTIETHRAHIMAKINIQSVAELVNLLWLSHGAGGSLPVHLSLVG